jgi:S-adenosyl methyltransferase
VNGLPADYFSSPRRARVYDYLLGGKDNYAPDREAADQMTERCPGLRGMARENRRFILGGTEWLARTKGIRQFLDLGCGFPSWPSVHDAARSVTSGAAVCYVDRDPVVVVNVAALAAKGHGLAVLEADVRDVEGVLRSGEVRDVIDPGQPVGVIFGGTLSDMSPADARLAVKGYAAALVPGSAVIASCAHFDDQDLAATIERVFAGEGWRNHSPRDVNGFFGAGGLTILQGKVGDVRHWPLLCGSQNRDAAVLGGIGIKP